MIEQIRHLEKQEKNKRGNRSIKIMGYALGSLLLVVLVSIVVLGCSTSPQTVTVKVAIDMPGNESINAMLLALDEAEGKAGNVNVELVKINSEHFNFEDNRPIVAALEHKTLTEAIADDAVVGYFGPVVGMMAKEITPLLNEAGIAEMSATMTWPGLTKAGYAPGEPGTYYPTGKQTFFRLCSSDDIQGMTVANWVNQQGLQSAYIVDGGGLYSIGLSGIFERTAEDHKINIIAHESIEFENTGPGAEATPEELAKIDAIAVRVVDAQPDVLYATDWEIIFAVRKLNPDLLIVGGDYLTHGDLTAEQSALVEGVYASDVGVPPDQIPSATTFIKNYKAAYDQDPSPSAVGAYDAMKVFLHAIEHAEKPTREGVLERIESLGEFSGALGNWHFDDQGDISIKSIALMQFQDDEWVLVKILE